MSAALRPGGFGGDAAPAGAPPPHDTAPVAVLVVTHNDAGDLPGCLAAVAALAPAAAELLVVDCASRDDSVAVARRCWPLGIPGEVVSLDENRGFAGGMNAALAGSTAPWVLTLNADAQPAPGYLGRLLGCAAAHPQLPVGAVTGRLLRLASGPAEAVRLDACGMRLSPFWRHLDRGSGEPDRGQLGRPERVFGGTGAATLFHRPALLDVAVDGEVFDSRFHTFREDAELCFRLRERRWEVLYEPSARCLHRRRVLPSRRRALSAYANYHSLKNRYLLRLYHQTLGNLLWTLPLSLLRDLQALAWVLLGERSSLPAYGWLWRHRHELVARRRRIQARRTASWWEVERWFWTRGLPL